MRRTGNKQTQNYDLRRVNITVHKVEQNTSTFVFEGRGGFRRASSTVKTMEQITRTIYVGIYTCLAKVSGCDRYTANLAAKPC